MPSTSAMADLHWAVSSPPMLLPAAFAGSAGIDPGLSAHWHARSAEWLSVLNFRPEPLEEVLQTAGPLIGKRFEALLAFWFSHAPGFRLLARNEVITGQGATLGELDLLVEDLELGEVVHLEVACKYYLGTGRSAAPEKWMGITPADTLAAKVGAMNRQLGLTDTAEGRHWLRSRGFRQPDQRLIVLKGYLFQPFRLLGRHPLPKQAGPSHHAGWWMHAHDLAALAGDVPQWIALPRERWIGRWHSVLPDPGLLSGDQLRRQAEQMLRIYPGVLVIQALYDAETGVWRELSRGMIVRDTWPAV
jgi:uncharacterized protein